MLLFTVLGFVVIYAGIGSALYGVYLNTSLASQLINVVQGNGINPGTVWIIAGAAAVLVGTIAIIVLVAKMSKRRYY